MDFKEDISRGNEDPVPRIIARAAGVVIVDEFRVTTPRAMLTAEGYDIKQTEEVNLSAPHSTVINRGPAIQLAEGENGICQDHTKSLIRPFEHLSRSFALQAADFREQITQRMQRNHIDNVDEEVRRVVPE
jgi:hypothetical protein